MSNQRPDVVIACNMGDFIYAVPAMKQLLFHTLALPPYLVPLATILRPVLQYEELKILPDDKMAASGAKGMSWRNLPADKLSNQFGLNNPIVFVMKGGGDHLLNKMSKCANMQFSLPVDPPLRYLGYTDRWHANLPVLLQAETAYHNRSIPWFNEIKWPDGTHQINTGQGNSIAMPYIDLNVNSSNRVRGAEVPTIVGIQKLIQYIRNSRLVVSVSSFTGVLAASMGVPTIMVHQSSGPAACGVQAFGQHDIRQDKTAFTNLLSQLLDEDHSRNSPVHDNV